MALEVGEGFGSAATSSPREVAELSCLGLTGEPRQEYITALSTLVGILPSKIGNLITHYDYIAG